jgi:uncharacterized protein
MMGDTDPTIVTENKSTVERYMQGFRTGDHYEILSCLTDDVEWLIPGAFHAHGKQAFDKEIENDDFVGLPEINVVRLVEENGVVVAEGSVRAKRRDGTIMVLAMCDVFDMESGKIKRLTSYLMETK